MTKDSQAQYPPVAQWPGTPEDRGISLEQILNLPHGMTDSRQGMGMGMMGGQGMQQMSPEMMQQLMQLLGLMGGMR